MEFEQLPPGTVLENLVEFPSPCGVMEFEPLEFYTRVEPPFEGFRPLAG